METNPSITYIIAFPENCELHNMLIKSSKCEIDMDDPKKIKSYIISSFDPEPWNGRRAYYMEKDRDEMIEKLKSAASKKWNVIKCSVALGQDKIHEKIKEMCNSGNLLNIMELG